MVKCQTETREVRRRIAVVVVITCVDSGYKSIRDCRSGNNGGCETKARVIKITYVETDKRGSPGKRHESPDSVRDVTATDNGISTAGVIIPDLSA